MRLGNTGHDEQLIDVGNQDMPATAIQTGCADFVLPIEKIAGEIVRIARGAKAEVETP